MQVTRLRTDASTQVASSLAESYQVVYDALHDDANGYMDVGGVDTIVKHTPADVRTILGIQS